VQLPARDWLGLEVASMDELQGPVGCSENTVKHTTLFCFPGLVETRDSAFCAGLIARIEVQLWSSISRLSRQGCAILEPIAVGPKQDLVKQTSPFLFPPDPASHQVSVEACAAVGSISSELRAGRMCMKHFILQSGTDSMELASTDSASVILLRPGVGLDGMKQIQKYTAPPD